MFDEVARRTRARQQRIELRRYPLLRRLEAQGLLTSEWRVETGPPRRYYALNPEGRKLYADLVKTWRRLSAVLDSLDLEGADQ